jgi:transcriptional regulator with XRE-family HTH domain
MRTKSPLTEWREQQGLSVADLAGLCNLPEAEIIRIEAGETGLVGEVQDYLTRQGANVSMMAAGHASFLAALQGEPVDDEDEVTGPWLLDSGT